MSWLKSQRRGWLFLLLFILITAFFIRFYFRMTDDFRVSNITYTIPYHANREIPALTPEEQETLDTILNQKFFYLGKGAQSYAFASEDGQYVLKFFKFKHIKPSLLATLLPNIPPFDGYLQRVFLRKQKKLNSIFAGYHLAFHLNRAESGLIFMQLNPSRQKKVVNVIDKIGWERTIDLGNIPYIVQRRGETLRTVLSKLLDEGKMETAMRRMDQLFSLFLREYQKGIYDRDHGVLHNTGFIGDQPFHLDVGKLSKEEAMKQPKNYEKDLTKVALRMIPWLYLQYPNEAPELVAFIESRLSEIFSHPVILEKN